MSLQLIGVGTRHCRVLTLGNINSDATGVDMTGKAQEYREAIKQKQAPGYGALGVMEQYLANHAFFTGDRYTIADIGLFVYTHFARESGFDLTKFPAI
ncbi:glutathione binding-like protein [Microcoleus sp. Pol7_A1]|uniref:glutathione S-transferase C-terminal domain-containing protein n=1 Tax=Microcoleus sp. Pol7_A1 TaxID=2818893 RepID=UPI002FCE987E